MHPDIPFSVSWHTLLDEAEELPSDATLTTPLSHKRFHITDTQEHRVIIEYQESGDSRPLQREQFETLYRRIIRLYSALHVSVGS
jgi:hypothetical protein